MRAPNAESNDLEAAGLEILRERGLACVNLMDLGIDPCHILIKSDEDTVEQKCSNIIPVTHCHAKD
jgi:hypothetical protein